MAPPKRARPSFSPPRPKKSKSTNVSTSTKGREASWKNQKNAAIARKRATPTSKYSGRKGTRKAQLSDDEEDDDGLEEGSRNHRSALSLVDASASEADDDDDDDDDDDAGESEEADSEDHDRSRPNLNSSPEPDVILAEITTTSTNTESPIPEQLVHKMLHHHFQKPEKTKISTDARDLVTKYLEVFVREAIMRSAFERQEKNGTEGGAGAGGGFLEVEDLERAAVQLCLDF